MTVLEVRDGAAYLRVHVQPGASRSAIVGRHGDALKLKVAAPPSDGKANAAVIGLIATALGVRPADLVLISGAASRSKKFRVGGRRPEELRTTLQELLTSTDERVV